VTSLTWASTHTPPEHRCRHSLRSSSWMYPSYPHCSWAAALTVALVPRWAGSHAGALSPALSLVVPPLGLSEPWTRLIASPCPGPALPAASRLCVPAQPDLSSQLALLQGAAPLLLATSGPRLLGYSGLVAPPGSSCCLLSVTLTLPGRQRDLSSPNSRLMPTLEKSWDIGRQAHLVLSSLSFLQLFQMPPLHFHDHSTHGRHLSPPYTVPVQCARYATIYKVSIHFL